MDKDEVLRAAHIPEDTWEYCFVVEDGMVFTPLYDGAGGLQSTGQEVYQMWLGQQGQPPAPTLDEQLGDVAAQLADTQVALTEVYEGTGAQATDLMLALTETYEAVEALKARVAALEAAQPAPGGGGISG